VEDGTWRRQHSDAERVQEFRKCIECFLCQDVCHVPRVHRLLHDFVGPCFFVYSAALGLKERVVDRLYDPLSRLLRVFRS